MDIGICNQICESGLSTSPILCSIENIFFSFPEQKKRKKKERKAKMQLQRKRIRKEKLEGI
jgi:hypothetical protein